MKMEHYFFVLETAKYEFNRMLYNHEYNGGEYPCFECILNKLLEAVE
jgi:hypothetical protein